MLSLPAPDWGLLDERAGRLLHAEQPALVRGRAAAVARDGERLRPDPDGVAAPPHVTEGGRAGVQQRALAAASRPDEDVPPSRNAEHGPPSREPEPPLLVEAQVIEQPGDV